METLLEKISSYQIFNHILPGTIFSYYLSKSFGINFQNDNMIITFIIYYFIGIIIGRISSIVIEPLFKKFKMAEYQPYQNFIAASKSDKKIILFSEFNNMYRSLITMMLLIGLSEIYRIFVQKIEFCSVWKIFVGILILIILFGFSYSKQSKFIFDRIDFYLNESRGDKK
jgi:hypothetical protein